MAKKKKTKGNRHSRSHKYRYVNTRYWNDALIASLAPLEKLLFIYLITNEHTNISGIYELPLKIMAMETGIDEHRIEKELFPAIGEKIRYIENYVVVKNFVKYQYSTSKLVREGILNCLREVPFELLRKVINDRKYILPLDYIDQLGIPYVHPIDTLSIPNAEDINTLLDPHKKSEGMDRVSIPYVEPTDTVPIGHIRGSIYSNSDLDLDKEREEVKKENASLSYLKNIPETDLNEFHNRFEISSQGIKDKGELLFTYCEANGKTYQNYRALLLNALVKDVPAREHPIRRTEVDEESGKVFLVEGENKP